MILFVAIFIASFLGLFFSARFGLKKLTLLTFLLQQRDYITGILFLGLSTSLPEVFVGINSALQGMSEISLANIIGSNMINLTLLIGITVVIAGTVFTRDEVFSGEALFSIFSMFIPLGFILFDGIITRFDGLLLITLFVCYYFWVYSRRRVLPLMQYGIGLQRVNTGKLAMTIIELILGLIVLFISANLLIKSGTYILELLDLPLFILGLIILTIGTILPELTIDVISAFKKRPGFALGNLYGTLVTNSCLVLGLTSLIKPIKFMPNFFIYNSITYLAIAAFLFLFLAKTKNVFSRAEGFVLVMLYILFLTTSFYLAMFR